MLLSSSRRCTSASAAVAGVIKSPIAIVVALFGVRGRGGVGGGVGRAGGGGGLRLAEDGGGPNLGNVLLQPFAEHPLKREDAPDAAVYVTGRVV